MEIEREENIVVRYIPQYIVIETRYKPVLPKEEAQRISETTSSPKYDAKSDHEVENSLHDISFDQWDVIDYGENDLIENEDNEFVDFKQIENFDIKTVDIKDSKLNSHKRKYNSKASKLLNEWFINHLHNPYPTEKEKDELKLQTSLTKVQDYFVDTKECHICSQSINTSYFVRFLSLFSRFPSKMTHVIGCCIKEVRLSSIYEAKINYWFINKRKRNKHLLNASINPENELLDDIASTNDGFNSTTVELEVIIQPDPVRKRRQKKISNSRNELPAMCDVCGKSFTHRYMLLSHLKRHDQSTWEECEICHKSFPDGLKRHMRVHSGERPYICQQCGAAYKQAYGLTMHKAIHNDSGELYYCDTCNNGKGYRSKYALKDHLKLHYRVRSEDSTLSTMKNTWKPPKTCTICGFETYNIRSHMIARHSTLRPFICEICSETFKFKKDLQTHYAYHSDEMNFECDECEKRFKTKRKLVIHKRIHSTEKLYKCSECDKSFLVSTYLTKHMRLHTGEKKRHACTECSKDYSGITDLRRHLEREHGIKIQPNPKYSNNNMTKKHKVL